MTSSITSFSYHNPTAIEFGWGALARLPELVKSVGGRRVLVVGDPGVAKAGLVERVVSALGGAFPVTIFTDVESDPDARSVDAGVQLARSKECDVIVGIGGWLASLIMRTDAQQGILLNVIVGIIGAFIGGWVISPMVGVGTINEGVSVGSILVSLVGAVILLAIVNLFRRGRVR